MCDANNGNCISKYGKKYFVLFEIGNIVSHLLNIPIHYRQPKKPILHHFFHSQMCAG